MIPFAYRFHGHNSLRYVYKNGQVVRSRFATLKSSTNAHRNTSRIAVVISKKVLKSAVRRNRVRRRIYEHIRINMPKMTQNYDIVVIVTSGEVLAMSTADLSAQIDQLFDQAGLYKPAQN